MKYISPFAILSRHNLAVFFVAGNAIFDDVSHAVFLQQSSILFLLDLSQCLLAGSVHISIFGIFQFNNDSGTVPGGFDQNVTVTDTGFYIGLNDPVSHISKEPQKNSMIKILFISRGLIPDTDCVPEIITEQDQNRCSIIL